MRVHGQVGVRSYTGEAIGDPRVRSLAGKVRYETKEYATYPAAFPDAARERRRIRGVLLRLVAHLAREAAHPRVADRLARVAAHTDLAVDAHRGRRVLEELGRAARRARTAGGG